METGLLIFLIWFMLAAIGVAASIKKRAKKTDQALNQKAAREEEAERRIREFYENMRSDTPSMEEEPVSPAEEAQPATPRKSEPAPAAKAAAQPAAEPVKKKELDFDPEEMVIYSEVMKPGYEKY